MSIDEIIAKYRDKAKILERVSNDPDYARESRFRSGAVAHAWNNAADILQNWLDCHDELGGKP